MSALLLASLGVSVSSATRGRSSREGLRRLRQALLRDVSLLVGGAGAPPTVPRARVMRELRDLHDWARRERLHER
jgi:hypothetical protein